MLAFAGLPVGHRKNDCSENCPALRLLISLLMELVKQWSLTHGGPSQKEKEEKVLEEYREKMQREKRNESKSVCGGQEDYQIPSNVEMCCPPEER